MIRCLLRRRMVLLRVGEDVRPAGRRLHEHGGHRARFDGVFGAQGQHGGDRLVGKGLGGKRLVGALGDEELLPEAGNERLRVPLHIAEDLEQALLALEHLPWTGVPLRGQERRPHPGLHGQRVRRVLHVRKLARHDSPEGEVARPGDPHRSHELVQGEAEHPPRDKGASELGQASVMPPHLTDPGVGSEAEPHLELVGEDNPHEEVLPSEAAHLSRGQRGGDEVRGVRRVLLPVDVVVVEGPNEEGVHERGEGEVGTGPVAKDGRLARPPELSHVAMGGLRVREALGGERTPDRIEEEPLRLRARCGGDVPVAELASEPGQLAADRVHDPSYWEAAAIASAIASVEDVPPMS